MRKILRIIVSPIVFIFCTAVMILFPGVLCFIMGMGQLISFLFIKDKDFNIQETLFFTFMIITFPVISTIEFIKTGKTLE